MFGTLEKTIQRVVTFALFILVLAFCVTKIRNWDIWWHLKTGEWIVRHGIIPKSDFFTYTSSGAPWIDLHWGFQVLFWAVYNSLGGNGLILCKALLCLATVFVLFRTYVPKRSMVFGMSLFFVTVLTISHRLLVRPEALSLLFLAVTLKVLWDYSQGKKKGLYALPLVQVLWVNIQGLFVLGLFVQWSFVFGEWVRTKWRGGTGQKTCLGDKDILLMAVVACCSTLVCLVNPYGLEGLLFPLTLFTRISGQAQVYASHIGEFLSIFGQGTSWTILSMSYVVLLVITGVSFLINVRNMHPAHVLILTGFAYLSIKSQRNINLFAVAAYPVALFNWDRGMICLEDRFKRFSRFRKSLASWSIPSLLVLFAVVIVTIFFAVNNRMFILENSYRTFGLGADMSFYPTGGVNWIKANRPKGPVFNNLGLGGCLIHALAPECKVFIDGRLEVHEETIFRRYIAAMDSPEDQWEALDKDYGFGWAVLSHSAANTDGLMRFLFLHPDWTLVSIDGAVVVFVKRSTNPGFAPINIEKWSPKLASWTTIDGFAGPLSWLEDFLNRPTPWTLEMPSQLFSLGTLFMTLERPAKAAEILDLAARLSPGIKMIHNNLGLAYLGLQRWDEAVKAFEKASALAPRDAIILSNLGVAYGQKGMVEKAVSAFKRAVALDSQNEETFSNLGAAYWQTGRLKEATEAFKQAARLRPEFADHHYALAVLYYKQGNTRQAIEYAEKAKVLGHPKAVALLNTLRGGGT